MKYLILFLFCLTAQAEFTKDLKWLEKNFGEYVTTSEEAGGTRLTFTPEDLELIVFFNKKKEMTSLSVSSKPGKFFTQRQGSRYHILFKRGSKFRRYSTKYFAKGDLIYSTLSLDRKWSLSKFYGKGLKLTMISMYKNSPDFVTGNYND